MLGIIAVNYVELYNKPSFILTNSKFYKCSSRSISGYDIGNVFYHALKNSLIVKGGGHSMAGDVLRKHKLNSFKIFLMNIMKNLC